MINLCPCGKEFKIAQWQLNSGRGKYCSQECKYKYRVRPKGLKYELKVENPTWIKPGQRLSPETEFKPGEIPHNFKGDQVGYDALHDWVRRHKGKPTECEFCKSKRKVQWANKSWLYKRELDDWLELCYWCHREYDMRGKWGAVKELFIMDQNNTPRGRKKNVL
jgi:hypothetical protein